MAKKPRPSRDEGDALFRIQAERAIRVIAWCIIAGCLSATFYSLQAASPAQFFSAIGTALAVAGASLLAGGLLGFLFGIPKRLQQDVVNVASQPADSAPQDQGKNIAYQENTNLEQISDWLTKILVGVGLTQLTSIPGALQNYANFTAPGLGNFASSGVFAIALLLYFLICGFLMTYLWTRLYLAGAFRQAELAAIGGIARKVSALEEQIDNDAKALNIVQRQLKPARDSQAVTQADLDNALKLASDAVRDQIFQQAYSAVEENWADTTTKPAMERAIPVLRALIASDIDQVNYLYHGWLGFALKQQRQDNWEEAEAEFKTAIQIRGASKDNDVWLELQRAEGRISHDQAFLQGKPSDDLFKSEILADLKKVAASPFDKDDITNFDSIKSWLNLNKISLADLDASSQPVEQ